MLIGPEVQDIFKRSKFLGLGTIAPSLFDPPMPA
jgi:hypothetical protein